MDVERCGRLGRGDARGRRRAAWFDGRGSDGRNRLDRPRCVLRKFISVDVHSHGSKTGITSKAPPNDDLANDMRAGSLAVACLADIPDGRS